MEGRELKAGQVLFTTEAPMGNVAQVPDNQGYILSQRTISFVVEDEKITDDFLAILLRSPTVFSELTALSSGGTAKGVSQKSMSHLDVVMPVALSEQTAIGDFFRTLDAAITLHQRKLDGLRELKKGYLQQMFPQAGERVPRVRFAGFSGEWQERRLGDMVERIKSYSLSRDVETEEASGYRYIHYGDIHKQVADLISCDYGLPQIRQGDYQTLRQGDLVLADASEDYVGIAEPCVILHDPTDKIVAGLHTIALRPQKSGSLFLYYLLHTEDFKEFGNQVGTGLKVFGITFSNLSLYETRFPGLEEQIAIGNFFFTIDNQITYLSATIERLRELKAAYLQKMFV